MKITYKICFDRKKVVEIRGYDTITIEEIKKLCKSEFDSYDARNLILFEDNFKWVTNDSILERTSNLEKASVNIDIVVFSSTIKLNCTFITYYLCKKFSVVFDIEKNLISEMTCNEDFQKIHDLEKSKSQTNEPRFLVFNSYKQNLDLNKPIYKLRLFQGSEIYYYDHDEIDFPNVNFKTQVCDSSRCRKSQCTYLHGDEKIFLLKMKKNYDNEVQFESRTIDRNIKQDKSKKKKQSKNKKKRNKKKAEFEIAEPAFHVLNHNNIDSIQQNENIIIKNNINKNDNNNNANNNNNNNANNNNNNNRIDEYHEKKELASILPDQKIAYLFETILHNYSYHENLILIILDKYTSNQTLNIVGSIKNFLQFKAILQIMPEHTSSAMLIPIRKRIKKFKTNLNENLNLAEIELFETKQSHFLFFEDSKKLTEFVANQIPIPPEYIILLDQHFSELSDLLSTFDTFFSVFDVVNSKFVSSKRDSKQYNQEKIYKIEKGEPGLDLKITERWKLIKQELIESKNIEWKSGGYFTTHPEEFRKQVVAMYNTPYPQNHYKSLYEPNWPAAYIICGIKEKKSIDPKERIIYEGFVSDIETNTITQYCTSLTPHIDVYPFWVEEEGKPFFILEIVLRNVGPAFINDDPNLYFRNIGSTAKLTPPFDENSSQYIQIQERFSSYSKKMFETKFKDNFLQRKCSNPAKVLIINNPHNIKDYSPELTNMLNKLANINWNFVFDTSMCGLNPLSSKFIHYHNAEKRHFKDFNNIYRLLTQKILVNALNIPPTKPIYYSVRGWENDELIMDKKLLYEFQLFMKKAFIDHSTSIHSTHQCLVVISSSQDIHLIFELLKQMDGNVPFKIHILSSENLNIPMSSNPELYIFSDLEDVVCQVIPDKLNDSELKLVNLKGDTVVIGETISLKLRGAAELYYPVDVLPIVRDHDQRIEFMIGGILTYDLFRAHSREFISMILIEEVKIMCDELKNILDNYKKTSNFHDEKQHFKIYKDSNSGATTVGRQIIFTLSERYPCAYINVAENPEKFQTLIRGLYEFYSKYPKHFVWILMIDDCKNDTDAVSKYNEINRNYLLNVIVISVIPRTNTIKKYTLYENKTLHLSHVLSDKSQKEYEQLYSASKCEIVTSTEKAKSFTVWGLLIFGSRYGKIKSCVEKIVVDLLECPEKIHELHILLMMSFMTLYTYTKILPSSLASTSFQSDDINHFPSKYSFISLKSGDNIFGLSCYDLIANQILICYQNLVLKRKSDLIDNHTLLHIVEMVVQSIKCILNSDKSNTESNRKDCKTVLRELYVQSPENYANTGQKKYRSFFIASLKEDLANQAFEYVLNQIDSNANQPILSTAYIRGHYAKSYFYSKKDAKPYFYSNNDVEYSKQLLNTAITNVISNKDDHRYDLEDFQSVDRCLSHLYTMLGNILEHASYDKFRAIYGPSNNAHTLLKNQWNNIKKVLREKEIENPSNKNVKLKLNQIFTNLKQQSAESIEMASEAVAKYEQGSNYENSNIAAELGKCKVWGKLIALFLEFFTCESVYSNNASNPKNYDVELLPLFYHFLKKNKDININGVDIERIIKPLLMDTLKQIVNKVEKIENVFDSNNYQHNIKRNSLEFENWLIRTKNEIQIFSINTYSKMSIILKDYNFFKSSEQKLVFQYEIIRSRDKNLSFWKSYHDLIYNANSKFNNKNIIDGLFDFLINNRSKKDENWNASWYYEDLVNMMIIAQYDPNFKCISLPQLIIVLETWKLCTGREEPQRILNYVNFGSNYEANQLETRYQFFFKHQNYILHPEIPLGIYPLDLAFVDDDDGYDNYNVESVQLPTIEAQYSESKKRFNFYTRRGLFKLKPYIPRQMKFIKVNNYIDGVSYSGYFIVISSTARYHFFPTKELIK